MKIQDVKLGMRVFVCATSLHKFSGWNKKDAENVMNKGVGRIIEIHPETCKVEFKDGHIDWFLRSLVSDE